MVFRPRQTHLGACPIHDLDDPLHDHPRQLRPRVRPGVAWRVAPPFAINLVANLLFMPIFAGLRTVPLAVVDIVTVRITILWMLLALWSVYRWAAVAQVHCFVGVSIATVIQLSITEMNWGKP